jgi:hypothetical protein
VSIHLRVIQGNETVVDLPDWDGPVPRVGDYLFHPGPETTHPQDEGSMANVAGCVRQVIWHLHERTGDGRFIKTTAPYVQITI